MKRYDYVSALDNTARGYDIDLVEAFFNTMDELEPRIAGGQE